MFHFGYGRDKVIFQLLNSDTEEEDFNGFLAQEKGKESELE